MNCYNLTGFIESNYKEKNNIHSQLMEGSMTAGGFINGQVLGKTFRTTYTRMTFKTRDNKIVRIMFPLVLNLRETIRYKTIISNKNYPIIQSIYVISPDLTELKLQINVKIESSPILLRKQKARLFHHIHNLVCKDWYELMRLNQFPVTLLISVTKVLNYDGATKPYEVKDHFKIVSVPIDQ